MLRRKAELIVAVVAMTMAEVFPSLPVRNCNADDGPPWPKNEPSGRSAEQDELAIAKAEAKRQRKAEKRRKDMGPNA